MIHGPELVESLVLPTGQFIEKAQEVQNKKLKCCREHHSRKVLKTNEDVEKTFMYTLPSYFFNN